MKKIINLTIVAHIDHGKSSLADQLIKKCGKDIKHSQCLDKLSIEQHKGITIKSQSVKLFYKGCEINVIDTPGHIDFAYEADRTMSICENALLLVDGTQGIAAQTLQKYENIKKHNINVIPVINKIDVDSCDIDRTTEELMDLDIDPFTIQKVSAKSGIGVEELLDYVIENARFTEIDDNNMAKTIVLDSWYNNYCGVFTLVKVISGTLKVGQQLKGYHSQEKFKINSIGYYGPEETSTDIISSGQIGYINITLKDPRAISVGETLMDVDSNSDPIEGFSPPKALLYSILYASDNKQQDQALKAIEKYVLNDPSFSYKVVSSDLHKIAFRCGFLGMLHMEVVIARLLSEFNIQLNATLPNVEYDVIRTNNEKSIVTTPSEWFDIKEAKEMFVKVFINFRDISHIGPINNLVTSTIYEQLEIGTNQITCVMPLSIIIADFNSKLLSATNGYSSFTYELIGFRTSKLCKLEIRINNAVAQDFAVIVHEELAYEKAVHFASTLKEIIPRREIKVKIQVLQGQKIIASETLSPYRKDVTAKCYGGDQSRKDKLLKKQAKGKKRAAAIDGNTRQINLGVEAYQKLLTF